LSELAATNPDADGLVGAITAYAGETLPGPKYRWCHGTQTLSRTEFSLLFSRLGELWGAGDGSTTFALPDFDKKFPVGVDSTGADTAYDKVGDSGGSASGSVSISGTTGAGSSHSHGAGSYAVTFPNFNAYAGGASAAAQGGTFSVTGTSGSESSHTHSFSGSGSADTIPPYKAVRFIIKVT
jgi:microcystin-dependent protein